MRSPPKERRMPIAAELVLRQIDARGYTRAPGIESMNTRLAKVIEKIQRKHPNARRRRKTA
jgi:hypothetical protein